MVRRSQNPGINSRSTISKLFAEVSDLVPVPDGVILRTDDDVRVWRQFTQSRPASSWREIDLLLLAKAVRLEGEIKRYQTELDAMGVLVENANGILRPNPLIAIIDLAHRQQLSIFRMLSLCLLPQSHKGFNVQGVEQNKIRGNMTDVDDLITR